MSKEFTIDIVEQHKDKLFITGMSLTEIAVQDAFSLLYQYGNSKKSKKRLATIDLTVESIIQDGDPVEQISAQTSAMLILAGESTAITSEAEKLRWRKKSGRLIRTSDAALTLASDGA